jgi:ATP phosphoribosyltransferase
MGVIGDYRRGRTLVFHATPNLEMVVARSRDIPRLLTEGVVDLAVMGRDAAIDSGVALWLSESLGFGGCRLMLALPVGTMWDPSRAWRIASRYPAVTANWAHEEGITVQVVGLAGSVEAAPRLGLADAVVDVVETGHTLRANGLEPVLTVLESSARLVTRPGESHRVDELLGRTEKWEGVVSRAAGQA